VAASLLTLPTRVTLLRLACAPLIAGALAWAFLAPHRAPALYATALVLFTVAAATDWLDGYLARKLGQTSALGAALDHSADKAIVTAALVVLAGTGLPLELTLLGAIILTRDVAVAGLREGLALGGRALPVMRIGKVKTVFEMVGVAGAIAMRLDLGDWTASVAGVCLWAATALALWSGALYFASAFRPAP
jgi:CDP-diacylglycerol--glycerol-3-phosphate 3-phosphatidyltransferase